MALTRIGLVVICSVLATAGSWAGQDAAVRVLSSSDITAEIGTDENARRVVAQVLTDLMVNHAHREFFLASQIRAEWLPSTPGVEFVRLADAEAIRHLSACGRYWLMDKVKRTGDVVSVTLSQKCGGTVRDYIVSFEGNEWRLGPPGTGKDGRGWRSGIGSGFIGGPPPECRCQ